MIEISFDPNIALYGRNITDDDVDKVLKIFHIEHSNTGITDDDIEVVKKTGIWRIRIPEKEYGKTNA